MAGLGGSAGTLFLFIRGISATDTSTRLAGPSSDGIYWLQKSTLGASSFSIPLLDDGLIEGTERWTFYLRDGSQLTISISDKNPSDTTPPTIAISSNLSSLRTGQTAQIIFSLSEESTDFDVSDIVVLGGVLSGFSGSGKNYTAIFTPNPNSTTTGSVTVPNQKFSDGAGNFNTDGADSNNRVAIQINTLIQPTKFSDRLVGTASNDSINALEGKDTVDSGGGNDTLIGGAGNDQLFGGSGADKFVFQSKLDQNSNVDNVMDFSPNEDKIQLSRKLFKGFGSGISDAAYVEGAGKTTADTPFQRLIYNLNTGDLFYDVDGLGRAAPTKIALIGNRANLSSSDFEIIA